MLNPKIAAALVAADLSAYGERDYSTHKAHAQGELSARGSHFADDSALRFFHSRIVRCLVPQADKGLTLALIDCGAMDYENTRRGYRFAVFDVAGNCIFRPDLKDAYRTKAAAEKAMWAWLTDFDAEEHTLDLLRRTLNKAEKKAAELAAALAQVAA